MIKTDKKYERNIHIIKIIIQAVLLCAEQGIALRGHREEQYKEVTFL